MKNLLYLLLILTLVVSCTDSLFGPDEIKTAADRVYDQVRRGNLADYESEHAALWISDELVAPEDLYYRIKDGLKLLRDTWSDSIPDVMTEVLPAYTQSGIELFFYDSVKTEYLNGNWSDLDSLNELFNADSISEIVEVGKNRYKITIFFTGRLNSKVLERIYSDVLNGQTRISDFVWNHNFSEPNMIVWILEDKLTFLIIKDYPESTHDYYFNSHFWYFEENNSNIEYIGYWNGDAVSHPEWFYRASYSFDQFSKYYDYSN